ncbi:arylacetamide deacetylase-like 4 isoform X2 [Grammomys surdaster]|uniref:arylacetamide deacetylase-like 4 isoform X2 n=1 Tax=Grammomys surdaster TaxID=491861 RepID=UPI00109FAE09|nr:arylacetamide deacetylase-like 4 isoform X2 [Grammomys surdaster]
MAVLWLVLLAGVSTFLLGVFVWVIIQHFLTVEIPSTLKHPTKLRFLHCMFLYLLTLGNILEKLRICTVPRFFQFVQGLMLIKKDPNVLVTDTHFGTVPVRLFKPKEVSLKLRRDTYHGLGSFLAHETDSLVLLVGYRKLPEYHHPVLVNDCLNATIYFLKNLEIFGVDSSQVVLCGDSLGGWAVAIVSQVLTSIPTLPRIQTQVLICPILNLINFQLPSYQQSKNVPFLTRDILLMFMCKYLAIDLSWTDAMSTGAIIPLVKWKKYRKWLSYENIPRRFWSQDTQPEVLGPFNEAAYLETKHVWSAEISPILADDRIIAQLPKTFLLTYENDVLRDDALLYKKRLEDQGIPVSWYHVEDGFHGCINLFDSQLFSFPCSMKAANALVSFIKDM